jgi:hypothetical protein
MSQNRVRWPVRDLCSVVGIQKQGSLAYINSRLKVCSWTGGERRGPALAVRVEGMRSPLVRLVGDSDPRRVFSAIHIRKMLGCECGHGHGPVPVSRRESGGRGPAIRAEDTRRLDVAREPGGIAGVGRCGGAAMRTSSARSALRRACARRSAWRRLDL